MLKVALVDDHRLFREGVRALLARESDFEIVGEAADAQEAVKMCDEARPDIVLLDHALPGGSGLSVARELRRNEAGRPRILFVSMHADEELVADGLAAGGAGWVAKDQDAADLVVAIRQVASGETYLAPRLSRFVVDEFLRLRSGGRVAPGPLAALSAREREVFDLLLRGLGNEGVAAELGISRRTVETHRAQVMRKLQLKTVSELFRFAAKNGMLRE